jgi:hypothetical protein
VKVAKGGFVLTRERALFLPAASLRDIMYARLCRAHDTMSFRC